MIKPSECCLFFLKALLLFFSKKNCINTSSLEGRIHLAIVKQRASFFFSRHLSAVGSIGCNSLIKLECHSLEEVFRYAYVGFATQEAQQLWRLSYSGIVTSTSHFFYSSSRPTSFLNRTSLQKPRVPWARVGQIGLCEYRKRIFGESRDPLRSDLSR